MTKGIRLFVAAAIAIATLPNSYAATALREFAPPRKLVRNPAPPSGPQRSPRTKIAAGEPQPHWLCPLSGFGLTGIYGGKTGYPNGHFMANIALKDSTGNIVASLYFMERTKDMWENPIPKSRAGQPHEKEELFYLCFPASALGAMLEQLRHTPSKLYIEYYDGCWRLATTPSEPVRLP